MEQSHIRNFCVISHVDHGKSTLSDRFLEITNTVEKDKLQAQFLDQNPISRERGITIKLAPVRMNYTLLLDLAQGRNAIPYTLNLIDTPGHVDFSYEVSRTLAACEGAILLVDATQGIQAQTVAHYNSAIKEGLTLIPVINKVDLPNAQVRQVMNELSNFFGFLEQEIICISAKTGHNVELVLQKIIEVIPPPKGIPEKPLRALIFDAQYDEYRGVIAYTRIVDGQLMAKDRILLFQEKKETEVIEVGFFTPYLQSSQQLTTGEIGYVVTGIKNIRQVRVGDTLTVQSSILRQSSGQEFKVQSFQPLPGYKVPKPMVFLGVYPKTTNDLVRLKESLSKLILNDTSLTYSDEYSSYLGSGFRVGFLGLLHAEIVKERLKREFRLDLLFTMPHVLYEKKENGEYFEPYMKLVVFAPKEYVGAVMMLCQKKKGKLLDLSYHDRNAILVFDMPYSMFIQGLAGDLKTISSGFASIDYEQTEYKKADLVRLEIHINGVPVDILEELLYKDEAYFAASKKTKKLKDKLPRQQFRQIIQAVVNGTIIAREEVAPFRKDVLAKMSGGDRTRKDKLLKKQKKGKSRMQFSGKVVLPQEALLSLIERS